jgi:ABC-2 type transport system ATP-binding protein
LAGPNGAGKTTLIRLLLGLLTPDEGEVRLFGQRPDDPEVRRRVGFVPEAAELPPAASPRQLVRRFARLRGLPLRDTEPQGIAHLERLGMAELLDRPAHKLSKGEKQRTLLALALLGSAELLVLDEPTDGLDPLGRALVRRVLREERARGRTVFLNSHLLSETERVCTRVGILHRGQLVREEVLHEPVSETSGSSAVVLAAPLPEEALRAAGARPAPSLQGIATEVAGATVLIDHGDLPQLNAALDKLRAAGALVAEVRRVRQDLEASFEAAVAGAAREPDSPGPPPAEAPPIAPHPLRALRAVSRVASEIAADFAARKLGWVALGIALFLIGVFLWIVHGDVASGAAAAVRKFGGPGGVVDQDTMAHWIGRWAAAAAYWALLPGSVVFAALFAPPLLEPRRSVLLLAQPISRGDMAAGIFAAVCAMVLCEYAFLVGLLFVGLRWLGVAVSPLFLLVSLPIFVSFAALYAIALVITYAVRNGATAGAVAFGTFAVAVITGSDPGARPGAPLGFASITNAILPRVISLGQQAMRLGGGERPGVAPFALTAIFAAAFFMLTLFAARRSEQ